MHDQDLWPNNQWLKYLDTCYLSRNNQPLKKFDRLQAITIRALKEMHVAVVRQNESGGHYSYASIVLTGHVMLL